MGRRNLLKHFYRIYTKYTSILLQTHLTVFTLHEIQASSTLSAKRNSMKSFHVHFKAKNCRVAPKDTFYPFYKEINKAENRTMLRNQCWQKCSLNGPQQTEGGTLFTSACLYASCKTSCCNKTICDTKKNSLWFEILSK